MRQSKLAMLKLERLLPYGVAIATTAIALPLTHWLLWQIQPALYPFFIAAVTISSWYGGLGPGLFATGLSAVLSEYFFFPELYTLDISLLNLGRISYFVAVSVLICSLNAMLRAEQRRAEKHAREARRNQELLIQNQESLHQSEERYRLLIEGVTDYAIFMLNPGGEIVSWSAGAERLFGYSETEILGQPFARLFTREAIQRGLPEKTLKTAATKGRSSENRWHLRQDNSRFLAHCVITPLRDEGGNLCGFSKIMQDITARTKADKERNQLLRREQTARMDAEAANRSKDEFLAILSHELRTPLTAIVGWTGMIRSGLLDQPKAEDALETIERNANLQLQLVEDLLDVSRMIRGDLGLNFSQINFIEVFTATIPVMQPAADAKAIQLRTIANLTDQSAVYLWGDSDRLQQVILNLLSNAIKFTPNNGRVTVQLDLIEVEPQSFVQFQVQDTGIGISADFLPYVFERFRQADSSNARSHKGLGLGLAIVQYIVQQHRGTIQVESPGIGQGATFTVKLPSLNRDQEIQTTGTSVVPIFFLTNTKILVVDDEADVRNWLTTLLETRGASVIAVESVEEALRVLEEQVPTVLISDIAMPYEDGYTLIQQVRLSENSRSPKAIALSAHVSEELRQKALAAGFQDYLVKPINSDQLIAAIVRLIEQSENSDA